MSVPEPDAHLQELLDELRGLRSAKQDGREQHYERTLADARRLKNVPLVHGSDKMDTLDVVVKDGALLSLTARGLPPKKPEEYLGISDNVYTAAGILYPDARVAFVFDPRVESPGTTASPWDSGAFVKQLCPDLPPQPAPDRRTIFARYSVPAPQYRDYMVCYVASCYRVPWDYLDPSCRYAFADPVGALSSHPRSRNFEVRIPRRLLVDESTLQAVFLQASNVDPAPAVADWLFRLGRGGVSIKFVPGSPRALESHVRQWIANALGYADQ